MISLPATTNVVTDDHPTGNYFKADEKYLYYDITHKLEGIETDAAKFCDIPLTTFNRYYKAQKGGKWKRERIIKLRELIANPETPNDTRESSIKELKTCTATCIIKVKRNRPKSGKPRPAKQSIPSPKQGILNQRQGGSSQGKGDPSQQPNVATTPYQ
ncbi:hypothetical protein SAMD00019534_042560 [Acytostelium subglobosum LB1]|uniref:hypothetical protein n=1 Tax=Acytostelium subglobosum LB1 TaxID=1410327 RepID=UPI000644F5A3|nr:hypothetical protein SAMD00019534_042560 [Acytostelium subglobosum LB1]GAM21081.1 hypothetical protein SAMD00019534_042560 [Acytostelium subglobosum LB1]|eukprot:XP_012756215.1 hypothetical protein SAMD00019534_042560 [Acytostelium subglobosum LB1]